MRFLNESTKTAFYRSGYPATGNKSSKIFYQVLLENAQIHFLKYCSKPLREIYVYSAPPKKYYDYVEELYLYNVKDNTISKVNNKSSVIKALPALSSQINKLCEESNWTLRTEAQITDLLKILK
jgi:hypothetical protein